MVVSGVRCGVRRLCAFGTGRCRGGARCVPPHGHPSCDSDGDQHADLKSRDGERDDEVAEHERGRGIGAASSSRWAPFSRSLITPIPANIVLSGISSTSVPIAT